MSRLNGRDAIPLHRQLRDALAWDIAHGRYLPGEQIPSERVLCETYGVSRTTVRHTVDQLVHEGRLVRVPAKGTFVAHPKIEQDLARVSRFSETVAAAGRAPAVRILSIEEVAAPVGVARALELSDGDGLVRIDVLGCADTLPLVRYQVYLKADVGVAIAAALREAEAAGFVSFSMIQDHLKDRHGLAPAWVVQSYEAGVADRSAAELLAVAPGAPIFSSTRVLYTGEGLPVEYDEVTYRGDQYRFTVRRLYA